MECSVCLVCQSSIYFERNIDLGMIIRVDVSLSKSIMDVTFSDFECWGQLALLFSISFLFCFLCWCFWNTLCSLGNCFMSESLQKGYCCWALNEKLNEDSMLALVCFWQLGCWCEVLSGWQTLFLGKEMWHAGKIVTDGKTVHVCIIVQAFVSICLLSFSDHPKVRDIGKLWKSGMLFLLPSYSIERLRWVFTWKDPFFQY